MPSGELAPIVPTSGWGLTDNPNAEGKPFKGHMPAWDGALFVMSEVVDDDAMEAKRKGLFGLVSFSTNQSSIV